AGGTADCRSTAARAPGAEYLGGHCRADTDRCQHGLSAAAAVPDPCDCRAGRRHADGAGVCLDERSGHGDLRGGRGPGVHHAGDPAVSGAQRASGGDRGAGGELHHPAHRSDPAGGGLPHPGAALFLGHGLGAADRSAGNHRAADRQPVLRRDDARRPPAEHLLHRLSADPGLRSVHSLGIAGYCRRAVSPAGLRSPDLAAGNGGGALMAEDSGQERTEEPTAKRQKESREKGQVARSKELNTLAVVMVAAVGLLMLGPRLAQRLMDLMVYNFSIEREALYNTDSMGLHLLSSLNHGFSGLAPLLFMLLVAALVGPVLLGGWLFSAKLLAPKGERLNPLAGLKRMLSIKALVELLKALAKFLVVLVMALVVLNMRTDDLLALGNEPLPTAIAHSAWVLGASLVLLASALILIAAVDVPFQIWDNKQKTKMTKQEVRDEYKDSEGKPEVK